MLRLQTAVAVGAVGISLLLIPADPGASGAPGIGSPRPAAVKPADVFDYPLPTWSAHCLGFGSQWRYCNGVALRSCGSSVWLHTGVDIATPIQPVRAAGDGVIAGYLIDPVFRGGVLIRHQMSTGVVITQYWHVWLRPGYAPGSHVKRGEAFADVADMGDRTHLHFAVFNGDFESHAWNGALPPSACAGFPSFPYRFVDPNAFLESHQPALREAHGTLLL